jgi:hypothetical protein
VIRVRAEIPEILREVCAREMAHRVEGEVLGEGRAAFEAYRHLDGVRVLSAVNLEVRDGGTQRQVSVEA